MCLLGPSGCGKSTLLKMIAGFMPADRGQIASGGTAVTGPGVDRCMLFQSATLFPWLTAKENVMYGPRARGDRTAQTAARAVEVLEIVGLKGFGDHFPHQLSGGMQHRVALARALINEPRILLMDEPFSALDAITRTAMRRFLLSLWEQQQSTIVFVTHDVDEATLLADRVCVMSRNPGRVADLRQVELPRPRDIEDVETVAFLEARRQIRRALEGAMGEAA